MEVHRVRRALLAGLTSAVVAAAAIAIAPSPAWSVEDVGVDRLAGTDRFGTAAEIALATAPGGSPVVAVASGRAFPDALAGAGAGYPVLLTEPGSLPDATIDAIEELDPELIYVLGGTAAVSTAVEQQLAGLADDVERVAGVDRYETAARVPVLYNDVAAPHTAIIATGLSFADALAGGPLTGGDSTGWYPIFLVNEGVPDATREALEAGPYENTIILGGTGAVSPAVAAELEDITGTEPVRLAGTNRFGTAAAVAEYAIDALEFPADEVLLANGVVFADALAGGPLGRLREAPILLTEADDLPEETEAFLDDHDDTIATITVLGGTAAVSDATASDAEVSAEAVSHDSNETIAVQPEDPATQANGSTRDYTASGLTGGVDIVLVRCTAVATDDEGIIRFFNANANTMADGTASGGSAPDLASTTSYISEVNGTARAESGPTAPANNDYAGSVAPVSGGVTFSVTGPAGASTASSCVVPVVFDDANSDNALNVATSPSPTEPTEGFGTGGATTFAAAAAGAGAFAARNVSDSNDAGNTFSACTIEQTATNPVTGVETETVDADDCSTYTYDANDRFQISSATVDLATFELRLTADDDIAGTYASDPAAMSTFNLTADEGPRAPTAPLADPTATTSAGATITFSESPTATTDSYRLVRVVQPAGGADCTFSTPGAVSAGTVLDPTPGEFDATTRPEITDTTAVASTDYCYFVVPVDDGDDGAPSTAVEVTTDDGPSASAPIISSATGNSPDNGSLSAGDHHQLVFSEAMAATSADDGSYTVTSGSNPLPVTIACGGVAQNADCTLSADGTTLRVAITGTFVPPSGYPLTISSTAGLEDTSGEPVNLAATNDDQVIDLTLTRDDAGPFVQTADMTTDPGADGFDDAGDVLVLTFSEAIVLDDADGVLTEAQLEAILGSQVAYAVAGSVRGDVLSGSSLRLTVITGLTEGVAIGDLVDGSDNSTITDGFGNDQVVNTTGNPVLTA